MGGRLWFPTCQAANRDLPESLPADFGSTAEYIAAFEALLLEEARESIRGEWVIRAGMGRAFESDIVE